MQAGIGHVELGMIIFWDQEDPYEEESVGQPCAVCGWWTDGGNTCSSECYQAWKGYSDPREYDPAFGG